MTWVLTISNSIYKQTIIIIVKKDYVYMHTEYSPSKLVSSLVKSRSPHLLQKKFSELGKDIGASICGELFVALLVKEHNG